MTQQELAGLAGVSRQTITPLDGMCAVALLALSGKKLFGVIPAKG